MIVSFFLGHGIPPVAFLGMTAITPAKPIPAHTTPTGPLPLGWG